jgi:hypothetical protein
MMLLAAGCGQNEVPPNAAQAPPPPSAMVGALPISSTEQSVPASARLIIRTTDISLIVANAADALDRIITLVVSQGGYVAESKQWRDDDQPRATATLRIPADRREAAMVEIRKEAIRVASEATTGQDVSEEFADLSAQLTNLQATEEELRRLLTSVRERTQKAADVLEVYKELARVRGEIDRIQGRMNYFKQMTAMSTIKLELIPDRLSLPIADPSWRPTAIASSAGRSFVASLKWIGTILIWLFVYAVPMTVVLAGLILLGRMVVKPLRRWRI